MAGRRIDALSETRLARHRRTRVGLVFQFFNLLDDLTVADNVLLPAQLGIDRYRDTYPGRLSGGERQRVAIACGPGRIPPPKPTAGHHVRLSPA